MAHIHDVIDTDPHYRIDGVTRTIVNIDETKRELVQGDHNSERFTFEMPRYFDGHDFSECNVVQIHFENADTYGKNISSGIYNVEDLQVKHDDDQKVMLSWLASSEATKYVGTLGFSIRFVCSTDGELDYVWSTKRFDGIMILQGVCNSESMVERHPDVIIDMMSRLDNIEKQGVNVTVDQVFDSESKNAQSGTAVAEAVENSLGYVNEVLATLVEVE